MPQTIERLPNGLTLRQDDRFFKLGQDSVLLSAFARPRRNAKVLDLGCGTGALALLIYRPDLRITGLEIQEGALDLFRQSIAATICLLAYPFLKKRKLLPFVLIVLIAATFHVSAVFLLPFYWVLNWKADGRIYAVIGAVCVPFYLFSNQAAHFLTQYLFPN